MLLVSNLMASGWVFLLISINGELGGAISLMLKQPHIAVLLALQSVSMYLSVSFYLALVQVCLTSSNLQHDAFRKTSNHRHPNCDDNNDDDVHHHQISHKAKSSFLVPMRFRRVPRSVIVHSADSVPWYIPGLWRGCCCDRHFLQKGHNHHSVVCCIF
jgi:hypothetical protein